MRHLGRSARRASLLILLVTCSFTLQACSISLQQIMQAAGGLLVGLSQQVSNPALRSLMQAAGMALGQSPQSFDQFMQGFAGSLATTMGGGVLPPGVGTAVGNQIPNQYPGAPSNTSNASVSNEAKAVLAALQSTGTQLSAQVPKEQIRSAAEKVLGIVPEQYRKQAVDKVTEEVYNWLQKQAQQQAGAGPYQPTNSTTNTSSPTGQQAGTNNPQAPVGTQAGGAPPTSGYPTGGNQNPQAPTGGGVTVSGGVNVGGVNIGGSYTFPTGK